MNQIRPRAAAILTLLLALFTAHPAGMAQNAADLVQVKLLSDVQSIEAGKPFTVAVELKIASHWHVYWTNPGDAGIPTTVRFELPEGFTVSNIEYPTPTRFDPPGGILSYGYAGEVMLLATVTPPASFAGANVPISATVKYLACNDSCIPGEAKVSLTIPIGAAKPSPASANIAKWKNQVPVNLSQSKAIASQSMEFAKSTTRGNEGKTTLKIDWTDAPPAKIEWFPPSSDGLVFTTIKTVTDGKRTTITADVQRLIGQKIDPQAMDSVVAHDTPQGRRGIAIPIKLPADAGW